MEEVRNDFSLPDPVVRDGPRGAPGSDDLERDLARLHLCPPQGGDQVDREGRETRYFLRAEPIAVISLYTLFSTAAPSPPQTRMSEISTSTRSFSAGTARGREWARTDRLRVEPERS